MRGAHSIRRRRPRKGRARAFVIACGLLLAAGLMVWPWALDCLGSRGAHGQIAQVAAQAGSLPARERERLLAQARAYNDELAGAAHPAKATPTWRYEDQLDLDGDPMMSWLEIPSLNLEMPIYHGTSEATLMAGVGHLKGTSLPVGGKSAHCVLTAHSGMRNLAMFDGIGLLQPGDLVLLHTLDQDLAYRVTGSETVWPDQVAGLRIERGRDLVTLVTCTPYGVNDHRLLVHCERTDCEPARAGSERGLLERHWGAREAAALLVLVVLAALVARLLSRRHREAG